MYARLLQEAFDAAERLKEAHEKGTNIEAVGDENADTAETARRDLDRIFDTGGVAALVGNSYGAAKDGGLYVTGEVIRGLADLEAKEREGAQTSRPRRLRRVSPSACPQLMVKKAQAALREVDLSPEQASAFRLRWRGRLGN
jgi:hypothetical protein